MPTELSSRPSPTAAAAGPDGRRKRPTSPLGTLRQHDTELRQIVLRVRSWGLQQGRGCATDGLTVVVGLALAGARAGRISPKRWTVDRVDSLLSGAAATWCAAQGAELPATLGEALLLWLDFLDAHGALSPGSDRVDELRAAAARRRGRARAASRRRHPAGRGSA
ncbi:MAG: hypothetical protein GEV08_14595 [Acidimicrobiia bacterium]|nr:hypothetical protein [Acidimicrobiia bacterium]